MQPSSQRHILQMHITMNIIHNTKSMYNSFSNFKVIQNENYHLPTISFHRTIVHFLSSVAHVWVPGANTTGPIVKKFFLKLKYNFYVSENFKF
jgi:hypothetical protein